MQNDHITPAQAREPEYEYVTVKGPSFACIRHGGCYGDTCQTCVERGLKPISITDAREGLTMGSQDALAVLVDVAEKRINAAGTGIVVCPSMGCYAPLIDVDGSGNRFRCCQHPFVVEIELTEEIIK